ncbi:hypothetical protein C2S52_017778 [Perilla frutescens var. hirtella]|nr:hypothetical protein C2S52_017778 [Perilla frutescens var. hirtella]
MNQSMIDLFHPQFDELKKEMKRDLKSSEGNNREQSQSKPGGRSNGKKQIGKEDYNADEAEISSAREKGNSMHASQCSFARMPRIATAAMYMDEKADLWFLEYVEGMERVSCEEFGKLVVERFSNIEGLKESYFVQSYISGLKEEIARMVKMFTLSSLNQTIQLARKQELQLLSMGRGPEQPSWQKNHQEKCNKRKTTRHEITVLIDTRSTHNFLDQMTSRRLDCNLECTNPLKVTVTNGEKLECNSRCPKLDWKMGKCRFCTPMRIIQLGGCDMVIRVDLLRQLGPVTFNFAEQNIKFNSEGSEIVLQGIKDEMSLKMISRKQFKRTLRKGNETFFGCLCMLSTDKVKDNESCLSLISAEKVIKG